MGSDDLTTSAQQQLERYGEEFLRMFDGSESDEQANQPRGVVRDQAPGTAAGEDEATTSSDDSEREDERRSQSLRQAPVVVFDGGAGTPTPLSRKRDRRNFLSPRVADVMRAGGGHGGDGADSDEEALLASAEFQKMAREVELLGAAHLDKHQKKSWEARALEQMGAKPAKSPRMPLTIGVGIEKKRREREAKAFEEDVASGMVRIKGRGTAKKRAARIVKRKEGDRGLKASDGTFRGGVLYIKKETRKPVREGRSGKRKTIGDDFEGDSRKRARVKRGSSAKSKGKKSSKKRR